MLDSARTRIASAARQAFAVAAKRLAPVDNFAMRHTTTLAVVLAVALAVTVWMSIPSGAPAPAPPKGVRTVTVDGSSTSTWCEHGNLLVLRTGGAWNVFGSDSESLRIVVGGCPADGYDK